MLLCANIICKKTKNEGKLLKRQKRLDEYKNCGLLDRIGNARGQKAFAAGKDAVRIGT
jgi:hypothetical protein